MSYGDFRDDVKIEKTVKVTIEGEAVGILSDVCELARRHAARRRTSARAVDEYSSGQVREIENFLQHIFDNT